MSKEDAVVKLSEMGFSATLESGVVMITVDDEKSRKKANKAIKEIGYVASFGVRKGIHGQG